MSCRVVKFVVYPPTVKLPPTAPPPPRLGPVVVCWVLALSVGRRALTASLVRPEAEMTPPVEMANWGWWASESAIASFKLRGCPLGTGLVAPEGSGGVTSSGRGGTTGTGGA